MGLTVNLRHANRLSIETKFSWNVKIFRNALKSKGKDIDINSTIRSTQRSYKEIKEYVLC